MMFEPTPTPTATKQPWEMTDDELRQALPQQRTPPPFVQGPARLPAPQTQTQTALDAENLRARRLANQKAEQELASTQPAAAPGNATLTGDEYLKTLPAPLQSQVKALSEGRLPIPTGAALRSPQVMQLWAAASQYDPALDASTYPSRRKAFQDRTSGMMARNITSLNTALGHLESLDKSIDGLDNFSGVPLINYGLNVVRNMGIRGSGSGANLRAFETARQAATEELTRAFRQSGGSVHDIEGWEKTLDEANSPEELHAAVKQMVDLLGSRVQAMGDQYSQAMGSPTDPMTLLNPHAADVFRRLSGEPVSDASPEGKAPLGFTASEGAPNIITDSTKDTQVPFSTDKDKLLLERTTALYNDPNSTRADFEALNKSFGAEPLSKEVMDQIFEARRRGGMITFAPAQSGRKTVTALEGRQSQDASSPVGSLITGAANGITAGHLDEITGGIHALAKGTSLSDEIAKANYAKGLIADAHPGYNLAGEIAGGVLGAKGAGAALEGTRVGALASKVPLAVDAGYGALYGEGQNNENRMGGALSGALLSPIAGAIGRKATSGIGSAVSPTGGALRPLYDEGVRPTLGQRLVDKPVIGPAINATEEALGSVPVFGAAVRGARQAARDQFQVGAFNSALREIDDKLPKGMGPGTDPHAYAQKAFGDAYDKARTGLQFVKDPRFDREFTQLAQDVKTGGILSDESAKRFERIVTANVDRRLLGNIADGGRLKDMQSAIGKRIAAIRNSPSGDQELAGALEDLSTMIDSAARRHSTPEAVAALDAADRGYAKLVRIETAANGAGEAGKFTPTQFDNAVKKASGGRGARSKAYQRGDALMQDYATAGRSLIDRVPNSGTAERQLVTSGVLSGAGFVSPSIPIGALVATAPYMPGVRAVTTALASPRSDGPLGRILQSVGSRVKSASPMGGKAARQLVLQKAETR